MCLELMRTHHHLGIELGWLKSRMRARGGDRTLNNPRTTALGQAAFAIAAMKGGPNLCPGSRAAPTLEITAHGAPRGKIVRQHAPLTAGELLIQQCVDNLAQVDRAPWAGALLGNLDQHANPLPLRIAKIGFVNRSLHRCLPLGAEAQLVYVGEEAPT